MQSELTFTCDNHQLTYTTAGHADAPPLLLIHGWLSYRGVWRQTMEAFKDSHYCVAIDLLGFGNSDKPTDADYSIAAQGQRVLQLADTLGIDRFALMGHSMGGQIALCIASMLAPTRVAKLVSVAGVVSARLTPSVEQVNVRMVAFGARVPQIYPLSRWFFRYKWFVHSTFQAWFHNMDAVPLDEWATDRYMAFQPGVHISAHKAAQAIHTLNLTSQLAKITSPTLAIAGQQDAVVPVSDSHLIKQYVPDSRLVLIEECGHFPMYEKPQQYLETLRAFFVDKIRSEAV
jgi:pimeloyl-ACP methyl ester carboxylesterase